MITKNIVRQPKSLVQVDITVPWQDLQGKWDETLQKMAAEVELPGFRKGQAPLPMVEQHLGSKLQDEVFKVVFPQALIDALQGSNAAPIDYPKYQIVSFSKGGPLVFKALVTDRPVIQVGDYKNIRVARPMAKPVTDDDLNKVIEDLYRRWKLRQPQTGDQEAQGPSGSLNFNQPQAASQAAASSNNNQPDDTFAKAVGAASLADLRFKIRTDLENEAKFNNEMDYEEAILREIEKITTVDLPDVLIEDEINRMMVSLQRNVSDMGLLLEDYLKTQNKTVMDLRAEWMAQAEKNVRTELGLSEIARKENIQVGDEELQSEIDKIQDSRIRARFEAQEPRTQFRHQLRQVKTLDLLKGIIRAV